MLKFVDVINNFPKLSENITVSFTATVPDLMQSVTDLLLLQLLFADLRGLIIVFAAHSSRASNALLQSFPRLKYVKSGDDFVSS